MAGTDNQNSGPGGPGGEQEPVGTGGQAPPDAPVNPPAGSAPAPQDGQGQDQGQQTPIEPPQAPRTDWRDRRIGELTARNREMRAEMERLRAGQPPPNGDGQQPRAPNGQYQQPAGYQGPPNQVEIDRQIQERAQIIAANQEFNRRCNDAAEAGRRVYADFDLQVSRLVGLVDQNDPQNVSSYNQFLNAALETGEASKIIHALGGDLNEASRILALNPTRMAVELTRMAARPVTELSLAPRPINPAATAAQAQRTSASPDDPGSDQMSTEEWMRRREEQIAGRNATRR